MKLCDICGTRHHDYQAHVFASNATTASNKVASNANASNERSGKDLARRAEGISESGGVSSIPAGIEGSGGLQKKQRWARESYNRYQRDYMRARRARVPS